MTETRKENNALSRYRERTPPPMRLRHAETAAYQAYLAPIRTPLLYQFDPNKRYGGPRMRYRGVAEYIACMCSDEAEIAMLTMEREGLV